MRPIRPRWDPAYSEEELEREEWRGVRGHESTHEVSNLGRVRVTRDINPQGRGAIHIKSGTILHGSLRGDAIFHRFGTASDGTRDVDQMVAEAFLPNAEPKRLICIRHKDGNVQNNRVQNLEWVESKKPKARVINHKKKTDINWVFEAYHYR